MLRLRARVKIPVLHVHNATGEKFQEDNVGVLIVKTEKSTVLGTKVFWDVLMEDGCVVQDVPTESVEEYPWAKSVVTDEATENAEEVNKEPEGEVPTNG